MEKGIVNNLLAKINRLKSEIYAIEEKMETSNTKQLVEEALNLFHGCGEGFIEGDYYAPPRYYSKIPGIKNLSIGTGYNTKTIVIKITSPSGLIVPKSIIIDNEEWKIVHIYSSHYSDKVDY